MGDVTNRKICFEHYIVKWTIENFAIFLRASTQTLESPPFELERSKTRFHLEMKQNSKGVLLKAKRDCGSMEAGGRLSMLFDVMLTRGSIKETIQGKYLGRMHEEIKVQCSLDRVLFLSHIASEDKLIVTFKMYVKLYRTPRSGKFDKHLVSLSSDLLSLYESGTESSGAICCDLIEGELLLHKVILAGRCPYFRDNGEEFLKQIRKIPAPILDKLVRYIYSGTFELTESDFSQIIEIHKAILDLKLPMLDSLFEASKIYIVTKIKTTNFGFVFSVEDIFSKELNEIKELETPNGVFSFRVYADCSIVPDGTSLSIDIIPRLFENQTCVFVDVYNSTPNSPLRKYRAQTCKCVSTGEIIAFPRFIHERPIHLINLKREAPGDILTLNVNFSLSSPLLLSENKVEKITAKPNTNTDRKYLIELSQNLSDVLDDGNISDIEICACAGFQQSPYKLHKAILAARWSYLADARELVSRPPTIHTYSDVMKKVLQYIYTGRMELDECSMIAVAEICFVALNYKLPKVRDLCYSALKAKMNIYNAHEILLWAKAVCSEYLQAMAMNYIRINFGLLVHDETWEMFEKDYPELGRTARNFAQGVNFLP